MLFCDQKVTSSRRQGTEASIPSWDSKTQTSLIYQQLVCNCMLGTSNKHQQQFIIKTLHDVVSQVTQISLTHFDNSIDGKALIAFLRQLNNLYRILLYIPGYFVPLLQLLLDISFHSIILCTFICVYPFYLLPLSLQTLNFSSKFYLIFVLITFSNQCMNFYEPNLDYFPLYILLNSLPLIVRLDY